MESRLSATFFDQLSLNAIKAEYSLPIIFLFGGTAYSSLRGAIEANGLALANANWNVFSTLCGTIIGYFYWGESLKTKHFVGLGLGCIALYLMDGLE